MKIIQTDENKITVPEKRMLSYPLMIKNNQKSNKENIKIDSANIFQNHLLEKKMNFQLIKI